MEEDFDVDDALNDVGIDLNDEEDEVVSSNEEEVEDEELANEDVIQDVRVFLIGDTHFKASKVRFGEEYIQLCVEHAKRASPTFIVCLGDTLDTNEIIRTPALKLADKFLDKLTEIAPTYLLIGNHDYINHLQYCTDNHGFGAFRKWPNLTIVDTVVEGIYGDRRFIFCPYVPKGRFLEALEDSGLDWEFAEAIFAHQEFEGCKYGAVISMDGDEWDDEYPPVFSGHIHEEQLVGENIYYPGSSSQQGYGDNPDKKVWTVTFTVPDEDQPEPFLIEKIDVGLRWKKLLYFNVEDVKNFDFSLAETYDVKIVVSGYRDALTVFKKSQLHSKLTRAKVVIKYNPLVEHNGIAQDISKLTKDDTSFEGVLAYLLQTKGKKVQNAYNLLQSTIVS